MEDMKHLDFIQNRRSIRKYSDQEISDDLLNDLLEESFRAATMGNMQLYSVIVTRDKKMKEKLAPAHFRQPMVTGASVVLTFCADFNRFSQWCAERDAVPGYDNLLSFLNAMSDALLVVQNFCTLAEANGLGLCYLGTTIYNPDPIIDLLKLPKLVMPISTITVGYPAENPAQTDRLPVEGLIHQETYHDYTGEDINRIYAYKESLPENHQFMKENDKATLAQVFTDVRYKKSDNEFMSDQFIKTLKRQGFLK
ncbi:NADPH-dependent oxidoreductase [Phocaeicola oris]|uniref:NADPH-dependent oxidoreductase n=1 Tax=Phocaeicola oris TaxID=2896850 RepID=UPI00234EF22F|nr:NADPH-dependent oxidoreductase [Phocaeicola oris]MCE2616188.1 NADPH-dependent oxidoreductase [Phocaeicola oris]